MCPISFCKSSGRIQIRPDLKLNPYVDRNGIRRRWGRRCQHPDAGRHHLMPVRALRNLRSGKEGAGRENRRSPVADLLGPGDHRGEIEREERGVKKRFAGQLKLRIFFDR